VKHQASVVLDLTVQVNACTLINCWNGGWRGRNQNDAFNNGRSLIVSFDCIAMHLIINKAVD
jgi:hypothetical protein